MGPSLCLSVKGPHHLAGGTILRELLPQTSVSMSVISGINRGSIEMLIPGCHLTPTEKSWARVWPRNLYLGEPPHKGSCCSVYLVDCSFRKNSRQRVGGGWFPLWQLSYPSVALEAARGGEGGP